MRSTKFFFLLMLLTSLIEISLAQNSAIMQWRGLNRDGVYNEKNLLKSWPEGGPALLWSNDSIGEGYGSPVIANNTLFINGEIDSISHVFAFDLKGQLLWKTPNGKEFPGSSSSGKYSGSRSTPTIVGNLLYACSGNGRIACLEAKNGKEVWAVDMQTDFSGQMAKFGYAESILTDGDILFCFPGNAEKEVAALNRFTGKTIWVSKALSDTISYCSPMLINLPSRKVIVNSTTYNVIGIDATTGEFLWSQKQENVKNKQQCNTPIFDNGYIYYINGDGNGAVKLELAQDGKSIKEIWRLPKFKNNFSGFVKIGGHIYSTSKSQKLQCIDIETGATVDSLKVNHGSIITADNMLFLYSDNGEVSMIKLEGTKMSVTGKFKINKGSKEHFAHPVINNGMMYIRHGNALLAYNIKHQ